jgi:hypothetical protein
MQAEQRRRRAFFMPVRAGYASTWLVGPDTDGTVLPFWGQQARL